MGMKGLFQDHRPHEVTIIPQGTLQADGTYAYNATEVDTHAWVRDRTGILRRVNGREIIFSRIFYFDRNEVIAVGDRVRYQDKNHEVLSVSIGKDINGRTDHKKAWTGAGL